AGQSAARTGRRTPDHPAVHPPGPAPPAAAAPPPAATTPTTTADRLRYGTRPRSLLTQGVEPSCRQHPPGSRTATRVFQGEVANNRPGRARIGLDWRTGCTRHKQVRSMITDIPAHP